MLVYEFLRAFNQKLDPAASKSLSAAKKVAAASKAILLGRQNGLHRITTFGLKYCHISKKSVGLLEVIMFRLQQKFSLPRRILFADASILIFDV